MAVVDQKAIIHYLQNLVEKILGSSVADWNLNFYEIGMKSVDIPFFVNEVSNYYHIKLDMGTVFRYPTVESFSNNIVDLLKNEKEKQKEKNNSNKEKEKIAIVGMSCRFPGGGDTPEEFWNLLVEGKNPVIPIPEERWDAEKYYSEDRKESGKSYVKRASFLDVPIYDFDAQLFNISPKEALALDPQQRLVLELVWEAFEYSGLDIRDYYKTNTGVYLGIGGEEYSLAHIRSGDLNKINEYSLTGITYSTAAGRISYTFGFQGPCLSIDTACSSTLTALHLASKALENGEVDTAIVAGVSLMLTPNIHVYFSKLGALAQDGQCKSFDASADGFGRGEGCGAIILKRLSDAKADHDNILGIVLGSAINQDGKSNGLTAPNGEAQEAVIRKAIQDANINPAEVSYIESHGTGTSLGDPIEVNALIKEYCKTRIKENPLRVGSVKSNIGHLEAASGIASIIKVILSFQHNLIPANLHFKNPNPLIDWENSPVEVISSNYDWKPTKRKRKVGINGFGFGGSNAHIIIEEPDKEEIDTNELHDPIYLLKVSAKNKESLNEGLKQIAVYLDHDDSIHIRDFVYTNNINKSDFQYRFVLRGKDKDELRSELDNYIKKNKSSFVITNIDKSETLRDKQVVFLYTGQGSQYTGIARELYENNVIFRHAMEQCDKLFSQYLNQSVLKLIYSEQTDEELINRTLYAQPVIFMVEYAMTKYWESLMVKPDIVIGHSIGEFAAAVAAGVFCLEDAIKLVAYRGMLMDSVTTQGAMLSIFADTETVNALIHPYQETVQIAVYNGEKNIVISGNQSSIIEIQKKAQEQNLKVKRLHVSQAFHSHLMKPILSEFRKIADEVSYYPSECKFLSTSLARYITDDEVLNAEYWTNHIVQKVDFYHALQLISTEENTVFLEVGPTNSLCALGKLTIPENDNFIPSLKLKEDSLEMISKAISNLYCRNVNILWDNANFNNNSTYQRVNLPLYAYNKKTFWQEPIFSHEKVNVPSDIQVHSLLGEKIVSPCLKDTVIFQRNFTANSPSYMKEHIIFNTPIAPAAGYLSMLLSIAKEIRNPYSCTIENVEFRAPLVVNGDESKQVQFIIEDTNMEQMKFKIMSKSTNDTWIEHCIGNISTTFEEKEVKTVSIEELQNRYPKEKEGPTIYRIMEKIGFDLGPGFKGITDQWRANEKEVKSIYYLTEKEKNHEEDYVVYAGTIDSILQTIFSASELVRKIDSESDNYNLQVTIPLSIESVKYYYHEAKYYWCDVRVNKVQDEWISGDIDTYNEKGEIVFEIRGFIGKLTNRDNLLRDVNDYENQLLYKVDWQKGQVLQRVGNHLENVIISGNDSKVVNQFSGKIQEKGGEVYNISEKQTKDELKDYFAKVCLNSSQHYQILYLLYHDKNNDITNESLYHDMNDCKKLLWLVQAITESEYSNRFHLSIVANNIHSFEADKIAVNHSTIWGFAKVISLECGQIWNKIIDVDQEMYLSDEKTELIIAEWQNGQDEQVVLRNNARYIPKLNHMSSNDMAENVEVTIDPSACYLITGGTGMIGQTYAQVLINQGAKNLILVCRNGVNDNVAKKIKQWSDQGICIRVEQVDISNHDLLMRHIQKMLNEGILIKGVVHTAGVLADQLIRDQSWESFEKSFLAKVYGTFNIHDSLKDTKLDFFIMMSSITSIIGNIGQANYAASNYFMNAFAQYRRSIGKPALAVCWGPWANGGMAVQNDSIMKNSDSKGFYYLTSDITDKLVKKSIYTRNSLIVAADIDWNMLCEKNGSDEMNRVLSKLIKNDSKDSSDATKAEDVVLHMKLMKPELRKEYLLTQLKTVVASIMGFNDIEDFSEDKSFGEQGGDSLIIFSMRNEIKKILHIDIDVSAFFNYPTLRKVVDYIFDEFLTFDEKTVAVTDTEEDSVEGILTRINELIK